MPTVATDFSFSHLQRTPGQTPERHIFGLKPSTGGTEGKVGERNKEEAGEEVKGGRQSHVADVGKQYPALSWHSGRPRAMPEISGARATHRPQQKVDTHLHSYTHTHTCGKKYTDY